MFIRRYKHADDFNNVRQIWQETGWWEADREGVLNYVLADQYALVAELNNNIECYASSVPGEIRHLQRDIPMTCITAVITGRIARGKGLAGRLTAELTARGVEQGALFASLGVFDQGFYNKLGFASGSTTIIRTFDPASLRVPYPDRTPIRLTKADWKEMHACRLNRKCRHGGNNLLAESMTRAAVDQNNTDFGLGFRDNSTGELTHYVWLNTNSSVAQGPYDINHLSFNNYNQFTELLGVLKSLGDQVLGIRMADPPGIQMECLLDKPFRNRSLTKGGKFSDSPFAWSHWQGRICNIRDCLAQTSIPVHHTLQFNLKLSDPISKYLDDKSPWSGDAGEYVITLGKECSATKGTNNALPTMVAGIGAFTRLWLGVQPASTLTVTDDLVAPPELLDELDRFLLLPTPNPDWDF